MHIHVYIHVYIHVHIHVYIHVYTHNTDTVYNEAIILSSHSNTKLNIATVTDTYNKGQQH